MQERQVMKNRTNRHDILQVGVLLHSLTSGLKWR